MSPSFAPMVVTMLLSPRFFPELHAFSKPEQQAILRDCWKDVMPQFYRDIALSLLFLLAMVLFALAGSHWLWWLAGATAIGLGLWWRTHLLKRMSPRVYAEAQLRYRLRALKSR